MSLARNPSSVKQKAPDNRTLTYRVLAFLGIISSIALSISSESLKNALHLRGKLHTPGHLLVFSAISFTALRGASSRKQRCLVLAGLCALCLTLELVEQRLFHGPMEWRDVGLDGFALAAGALFAAILARK